MILFTIGVLLYTLGVRIAAWFGHRKARLWVKGRQNQGLRGILKDPTNEVEPVETASRQGQRPAFQDEDWIWFHAASLGEFEQGRPLIESLKRDYPQCKILLSFFSPSGYEIRKDYPLADEVLYLPPDTPRNAAAWLSRHHFVAAFFIKYEFWFNYMRALKKNHIPLFYISLILSEKSFFFKPYGRCFRAQLATVTHFFVQDEATAHLLQSIGYENVTVCGDTRFDRVAAIAQQAKPFPEIERFIEGRKCIIAGSTWPPDEKLLAAFLPKLPDDYCLILAPHDISKNHITQIQTLVPEARLYTELHPDDHQKVLILNVIGILSQLYQYARFVYIGGGFGVNIHNIQEPVTFGCPVVFGPKHTSFKEAVDLVELGGAFSVSGQSDMDGIFGRLINDEIFRSSASTICLNYLQKQLGATEIIMKKVSQILFQA